MIYHRIDRCIYFMKVYHKSGNKKIKILCKILVYKFKGLIVFIEQNIKKMDRSNGHQTRKAKEGLQAMREII